MSSSIVLVISHWEHSFVKFVMKLPRDENSVRKNKITVRKSAISSHITNIYHGKGLVEISISDVKPGHVQLTFAEKELEKKKNDKSSSKKERLVDSSEPITMFQEVFKKDLQSKDKQKYDGQRKSREKRIIGFKKDLAELQEYSFGKFLEQYFYNPDLLVQYTGESEDDQNLYESSSSDSSSDMDSINSDHKVHRDLIRTFTLGGYRIKMKYRRIDTYKIDIIKFRDIDNSTYLQSLSKEELDSIRENFPV